MKYITLGDMERFMEYMEKNHYPEIKTKKNMEKLIKKLRREK